MKDSSLWISVLLASLLFVANISLMFLFAGSVFTTLLAEVFQFSALVGAVLLGVLISVGRYFGVHGPSKEDILLASIGIAITQFTFSTLGGIVIGTFDSSALLGTVIAGGATPIVASIIGVYVYTSDSEFRNWAVYPVRAFLVGLGLLLLGDAIGGVAYLLGFVALLAGWLFNIGYEVWMTSGPERSPVSNGIVLYVAVTGAFVHILQLVLNLAGK